ncbi:MAG: (E)-4-hydroxy-3-methylbut-2-enyl-diphosphate synthase, partial [Oscillospiraceae bacterium]
MNNRKQVKIKDIILGTGEHIFIQSMLNCSPHDIEGNVDQAIKLYEAGCEIIRVSVPNENALSLIKPLKNAVPCPIVADIHFDYNLALQSIEQGIDKVRINPGNIGSEDKIKKVVDACKYNKIPIRIGVNAGSLEKHILAKYKKQCAEALVESALYHINLLEKFNFDDIIVSIKSSNVKEMINAYEMVHEKTRYPLHLGVTEAGTERMGLIKSSIGIGSLLSKGIGDTIRVSLTEDPIKEIAAAKDILKAL